MDCKTGTLIDLRSPEQSQEFKSSVVSNSTRKPSVLCETSHDLFLNKLLNDTQKKTIHSSPLCGVLIDLDFSGFSPSNGSGSEISVQSCETSRFAEHNTSGLTQQEKSNGGSLYLNEKESSTSSSGNVNSSWSPSMICKDTDLLENEEFDFNLSMSSISPEREDISLKENGQHLCTCEKKSQQLSTPQRDWSLLNDAFVSEISTEAAKVVTHLSAKKVYPERSEADLDKILAVSLNSSLSIVQPDDLNIKYKDSLLDSDDVLGYKSSKNQAVDNFLICTDKYNSMIDTECVKSKLLSELTEVATVSASTKDVLLENKSKNLEDCIVSNLNVVEEENSSAVVNVENSVDIEDKENIPVGEAEINVYNYHSSDETSECAVNPAELVLECHLSPAPEQKCKISSTCPPKQLNSLIRRETFTLKKSPLQQSNKNASTNKTVNASGDGKGKAKKRFSTPKFTVHKRHSLSPTRKVDLRSRNAPTLKETCTKNPAPSTKILPATENHTSSVTNDSTPTTVNRIASFTGKIKNFSSKVTAKSKCESTPTSSAASLSKSSPKGSSADTFKTPPMPKRTILLPSKLSHSQSRGIVHSASKASTPIQRSNPVTKANSFRLSACSSLVGPASKRPEQGNKQRSSSAGEIIDSGLGKRSMPMKAIAPLSNMVKATVNKSSGTYTSNSNGNKGKTPSLTSRGPKLNAVPLSEPAKCYNSRSSPKSDSTSRPRFLSQTDSTPTSVKSNVGVRRFSFVPTPTKRQTQKRSSEKF